MSGEFSCHLRYFLIIDLSLFLPDIFDVAADSGLQLEFDLMLLQILIEQVKIVSISVIFPIASTLTGAQYCVDLGSEA